MKYKLQNSWIHICTIVFSLNIFDLKFFVFFFYGEIFKFSVKKV